MEIDKDEVFSWYSKERNTYSLILSPCLQTCVQGIKALGLKLSFCHVLPVRVGWNQSALFSLRFIKTSRNMVILQHAIVRITEANIWDVLSSQTDGM